MLLRYKKEGKLVPDLKGSEPGGRQRSQVKFNIVLCFVQGKRIVELIKVTWGQKSCDKCLRYLPTLLPTLSHG